jgi:hypothetical protein
MLFSNALALLRKAHYALEDLPDTISFPKHPAREAEAPVALEQRRHGPSDFTYLAIKRAEPVAAAATLSFVQPLAAAA